MKSLLAICAVLLTSAVTMCGQVPMASSHPPTAAAVAPKPNRSTFVPPVSDKPVARVNGVVLTQRDLAREEYAIFPYAKTHGGIPIGVEPNVRRGAMQMIIFEELVYQEAKRRNFTIPPARVDKAMVEFRKQFHSPDEYKAFLKQECNGSEQVARTRVIRSLTIDAFLKQEVDTKSVVSVAEARAYYQKNFDNYRMPESYSFQSISIIPPDKSDAAQLKEAKKHADDAYRQAKATRSYDEFGLLAEKISEDNYRVMMGDHKAVEVKNIPPPVLEQLKKMRPGQLTDLLSFDGIYTVVRMNRHNPPRLKSFDEVKDSLRQTMQQEKTERLRSSLDKKLYSAGKVETL